MKHYLILLACWTALMSAPLHGASTSNRLTPEEAAARVQSGESVLIDVREPTEWAETGVVAAAHLLSLSDLRGDRALWTTFLEENAGRELILYCRSGNRSGQAAQLLAEEGFKTFNAGGFSDWVAAGQPVRNQDERREEPQGGHTSSPSNQGD